MSVSVAEEKFDQDKKFADFLNKWAKSKGFEFIPESFDGREDVINGMAVDDVWGWLLKDGEEKTDENYGCVEWSIQDGNLILEFNDYNKFF